MRLSNAAASCRPAAAQLRELKELAGALRQGHVAHALAARFNYSEADIIELLRCAIAMIEQGLVAWRPEVRRSAIEQLRQLQQLVESVDTIAQIDRLLERVRADCKSPLPAKRPASTAKNDPKRSDNSGGTLAGER